MVQIEVDLCPPPFLFSGDSFQLMDSECSFIKSKTNKSDEIEPFYKEITPEEAQQIGTHLDRMQNEV